MSGSFFDTNILVHLAQRDAAKAEVVERLVAGGGTISVQVLNEIVNVSRRKYGKEWPEIQTFLSFLREALEVVPITIAIHEDGLRLAERHHFSTYDSMIIAAALSVGAGTLWSEDMQNGMVIDRRLTVRNPFAS